MAKKSYNEKLRFSGDLPKTEVITDPRQIARYGPGRMLVAPPSAYDALMKAVPEGALATSGAIRARLAREAGADITCPLTAGIFINIAAHASVERGGTDPTPYWRTLRTGGELNEKYPGGLDAHQHQLEAEGHQVVPRGKRRFVQNYEAALWEELANVPRS